MEKALVNHLEGWESIIGKLEQVSWSYNAQQQQFTIILSVLAMGITIIAYLTAIYLHRPIPLKLGGQRSRVKKPQEPHSFSVTALVAVSFSSAIALIQLLALVISPWVLIGLTFFLLITGVGIFVRHFPHFPLVPVLLIMLFSFYLIGIALYTSLLKTLIFLLIPLFILLYTPFVLPWLLQHGFGLQLTYEDAETGFLLTPVPKKILQTHLTEKEKLSQKHHNLRFEGWQLPTSDSSETIHIRSFVISKPNRKRQKRKSHHSSSIGINDDGNSDN